MAKKNKKKKKKGRAGTLFGNGAAGVITSGFVLNVVSLVITDLIESYLSDEKNRKRLKKLIRRMTSQPASSRA